MLGAAVLACSSVSTPAPAGAANRASTQDQNDRAVSSPAMSGTITIGFAGDVMLGRLVNQTISQKGYDHPWGDMLPVLQQTDLFLINLETTLPQQTAIDEFLPMCQERNFSGCTSVMVRLITAAIEWLHTFGRSCRCV